MQLDWGGEGGVDLAFAAGFQDMELPPLRARRFLHLSNDALGSRNVRVQSQRPPPANSPAPMPTPVRLPPGRASLAPSPSPTGSAPPRKTIGIDEVPLFAA